MHVWKAVTDWPAARLAALAAWLDPAEQDHAARFRFPQDRSRFIARRLLLRAILSRYLDLSPQAIVYQISPYGKPAVSLPSDAVLDSPDPAGSPLPDVRFSLSHSAGLALVAVSVGRELGVDLEQIHLDFDHTQVAQRFYSSAEQAALRALPLADHPRAFFAGWTRKEAYIKAVGLGLSLPLDAFDVSLSPDEPACLLATRQGLPGAGGWTLAGLDPAPDYAAAICVQGQGWDLQTWALEDPPAWVTRSLSQVHFG